MFFYCPITVFFCILYNLQIKCDTVWKLGAKGGWSFQISDLVKTLMELIFNPYGKFQCNLVGPVSQIYSPHLLAGVTGIF